MDPAHLSPFSQLTTSSCLSHHPSTSLHHLTFGLTQTQPNNSDPHSQHPFSPTTVTNPPTQQNERRTPPLPPPNLRLQDHPLRPALPDPRFLSALGSRPARRVRAPEHRTAGQCLSSARFVLAPRLLTLPPPLTCVTHIHLTYIPPSPQHDIFFLLC